MKSFVFGKNGFLATKLKIHFKKKGIQAKFFSAKDIDLTKKNSVKKIIKYKKKYNIIFLSALTPDKGKDEKTFVNNILMITNLFKYVPTKNINHFL